MHHTAADGSATTRDCLRKTCSIVTERISPGATDGNLPILNVVMATKCEHWKDRESKLLSCC